MASAAVATTGDDDGGTRRSASRTLVNRLWDRHFVPRPLRDPDEWAGEELWLSPEESSDSGRFSARRTPFIVLPLRMLSPRNAETRVVSMRAPAQLGKTIIGLIIAGHRVTDHPCTIWALFPTDILAKDFKRDRWDPIIDSSPALRKVMPQQRSREGSQTKTFAKFPGGSIKFVGANVPWGLRSKPVQLLIEEEFDALSRSLKGEGTAAGIAEARQRRVRRPKLYRNSTPTIEGESAISNALAEAEACFEWRVPCPHCETTQVLTWEAVKYDKPPKTEQGKLAQIPNVTVTCVSCAEPIEERHKRWMLARGAWAARWDYGRTTVAFDGATLALLAERPWGAMAAKYELGLADPEVMREFRNLDLGLPYEEDTDAPDTDDLYGRREAYPAGIVPVGARFLVAGVDVQDGWLACEVVAYGRNDESWSIDYRVIVGDTTDHKAGAWLELRRQILNVDWPCAGGGSLPIRCMAIDSGYQPEPVYGFARESSQPGGRKALAITRDRTVMVVKGRDNFEIPIGAARQMSADEKVRGVKVVLVGVSLLRRTMYQWLQVKPLSDTERAAGHPPPRGLCHFPADEAYDATYFAGLTNAKLTLINKRGVKRFRWDKPKNLRHEPGDCRVYARAAAIVIGVARWRESDWRAWERKIPSGLLSAAASPPSGSAVKARPAPMAVEVEPSTPAASAPESPTRRPPRGPLMIKVE